MNGEAKLEQGNNLTNNLLFLQERNVASLDKRRQASYDDC